MVQIGAKKLALKEFIEREREDLETFIVEQVRQTWLKLKESTRISTEDAEEIVMLLVLDIVEQLLLDSKLHGIAERSRSQVILNRAEQIEKEAVRRHRTSADLCGND
jgi:hypothetical protein